MTKRFDRDEQKRHHIQTFRAIRTLPPDISLEMNSYGQLFETINALGMGYEAFEEMFRRMAFNVYSDETDDPFLFPTLSIMAANLLTLSAEKIKEKPRCNALVTIRKTVVFRNEIKKVGRFFL